MKKISNKNGINNRNKNVTTLSVRYRVFVLDDGLKPIDKLMNITITVSMCILVGCYKMIVHMKDHLCSFGVKYNT